VEGARCEDGLGGIAADHSAQDREPVNSSMLGVLLQD
jgi:hypothetical protein